MQPVVAMIDFCNFYHFLSINIYFLIFSLLSNAHKPCICLRVHYLRRIISKSIYAVYIAIFKICIRIKVIRSLPCAVPYTQYGIGIIIVNFSLFLILSFGCNLGNPGRVAVLCHISCTLPCIRNNRHYHL